MNNIALKDGKLTVTPKLCFRILMVLVWIQNTVLTYVIQIFRKIPVVGSMYQFVIPTVILIMTALSLPYITRKLKIIDLLFYMAGTVVMIASILIFPQNAPYIQENLASILLYSFPMFFLGLAYLHEDSRKDLFWGSLVGVIISLSYQLYCLASGRILNTNNMSEAYEVLPSILFLVYWAFVESKIRYWILAIAGVGLLFVYGTRGPLLGTVAFILLQVYDRVVRPKPKQTKWLYLIGVGLVLVFLIGNITTAFLESIADIFEEIGFSTRIIDLIIEGEIAGDNGRNKLQEIILRAIGEKPLLGYGVMGDRVLLGVYAHNLVLELWCDFGVVLGSVLLIIFLFIPIKALWKTRNTDEFAFIEMFVCFVFLKLMFSGSYIIEPYFYLLMGFSVGAIRRTTI